MANFLNASIFLLVADEEGTIEEQEMMEGEADHKAELADLAKDGNFFTSSSTLLLQSLHILKGWIGKAFFPTPCLC